MALLGNVIWFIFGGLIAGLLWAIVGAVAFITVIGIPWGRACFMLANFSFFPFGRVVINREKLTKRDDIGTGKLGTLGNIIWFILAGWWLALLHVLIGVVVCLTIIGIPFGIQHFKLAGAALLPVGKTVVDKHVAAEAHKRNAEEKLNSLRLPRAD
ncbi:MAG: YccF domain-containing protein [Deltaproteobacteria bacterium]|jgi:uncharacterized membrane protein YccF (DUF307 family)|nr:YccF domain-containing protein [Deltaproteobacteria bacterium]